MHTHIVAVDGQAAAGKSVCRRLADRLGFALLDSGSIYRTLAMLVLEAKLDPDDTGQVPGFLAANYQRLTFQGDQLALDGRAVGDEIRTEHVSIAVPKVAKQPDVRRLIIPLQRNFNGGTNIVAEGRDMGSVVFRDAPVKIFLWAVLRTRAKRRLAQYKEMQNGHAPSFSKVLEELRKRDFEDQTRADSPLIWLPEAALIDTTERSKDEVLEEMLKACTGKL